MPPSPTSTLNPSPCACSHSGNEFLKRASPPSSIISSPISRNALRRKTTPYVFSGLSYFIYDELFVLNGETRKDHREGSLAIPMIVGIKSNLIKNFVIGVEVGARYTFTDNLDGSNPKNENLASLKFGNINSNDWYFFSGITITYTFGEKPCYCAE